MDKESRASTKPAARKPSLNRARAAALAVVHAELILIHPFREGNGRIARLLAVLMGLQAGLPPMDFSPLEGRGKAHYIAGIHAALDRDYAPLAQNVFASYRPDLEERCFQYSISASAVGVFSSNGPAANGWRMPSTAEDVFADTHSAEAAAVGERRKRLDLASFMPCILP